MKVQLIHPPLYLNVKAMTALRPSLPLGLAYIAAALRKAGHDVSVIDAVGEAPDQVTQGARSQLFALGLTIPQIVERLDPEAEVFGVNNMWSFSWPLVRELIRNIKKARPDTPILCGGEHFTGLPEFSMEQAPIDFVAQGEGEETAIEVLEAIQTGNTNYHDIHGIWYRDENGKPKASVQRRERNAKVDEIPWPAWDLFKVETYTEQGYVCGVNAGMTIPILATRGCPYQCTYCANPGMWGTKWHPRDAKDVVDEIESYYKTYGATNFPFQDLTAILKRDWIIAFCKELLTRNMPITWQFPSGTRCEVVDDEVASLLARSGGKSMAFAPESGSERTRKLIKKRMKTDSLMTAVRPQRPQHLDLHGYRLPARHEGRPPGHRAPRAQVGPRRNRRLRCRLLLSDPEHPAVPRAEGQRARHARRRLPVDSRVRERGKAPPGKQLLRSPEREAVDPVEIQAPAQFLRHVIPVPALARIPHRLQRDAWTRDIEARDLPRRHASQDLDRGEEPIPATVAEFG